MSRRYERPSQPLYQRPASSPTSRHKKDEESSQRRGGSSSPTFGHTSSPISRHTKGGIITLRMSRKAKAKLKKHKSQSRSLIQMIEQSSFVFTEDDLDIGDYLGRLNLKLSQEQYQLIIDAARRYDVNYYQIVTALIIKGRDR